jgi:hypothetical protein
MADVPFQPGAPLPGDTAEEIDKAFAEELSSLGLPLAFTNVETHEQAEQMAEQVLKLDLTKLRTGVRLDPLSRDVFRERHDLLGDWIADRPVALGPEFQTMYDAYCVKPTKEGLFALQDMVRATIQRPKTAVDRLSGLKLMSLLEYQHLLRTGERVVYPQASPVWLVGEFMREYAETTGADIGLTGTQYDVHHNTGLEDSSAGWMWLAWINDPSLKHVSMDKLARNGHYFVERLWQQGPFGMHAGLVVARRVLEDRKTRGFLDADLNSFTNDDALKRFQPNDPATRLLYKRMCANLLTMFAYLLEDDMQAGHVLTNPAGTLHHLSNLQAYTKNQRPVVLKVLADLKPLAKKQAGD